MQARFSLPIWWNFLQADFWTVSLTVHSGNYFPITSHPPSWPFGVCSRGSCQALEVIAELGESLNAVLIIVLAIRLAFYGGGHQGISRLPTSEIEVAAGIIHGQ